MSDLTLSILLCRALCSANIDLWEEATHNFETDMVSGFCRRYKLLPFIPIESKNIARKYANIKAEITALRMATEEVNRLQIQEVGKWFREKGIESRKICLLKGHALLNTVIKDSPWRTCSDVDCLIQPEDLIALCQNNVLVDHSPEMTCRFHRETVWSPKNVLLSSSIGRRNFLTETAAIDFHWNPKYLFQDGYLTFNQDKVFARAKQVHLEGIEFSVPSLADLYSTTMLHAVDGWHPGLKDIVDLGFLLPAGDLKLPILNLVNDEEKVASDNYLQSYLSLLHHVYRTDLSNEDFPDAAISLLKRILNNEQRLDTISIREEANLSARAIPGLSLKEKVKVYLGYFLPNEVVYRHKRPDIKYPRLFHPLQKMKNILLKIFRMAKRR